VAVVRRECLLVLGILGPDKLPAVAAGSTVVGCTWAAVQELHAEGTVVAVREYFEHGTAVASQEHCMVAAQIPVELEVALFVEWDSHQYSV